MSLRQEILSSFLPGRGEGFPLTSRCLAISLKNIKRPQLSHLQMADLCQFAGQPDNLPIKTCGHRRKPLKTPMNPHHIAHFMFSLKKTEERASSKAKICSRRGWKVNFEDKQKFSFVTSKFLKEPSWQVFLFYWSRLMTSVSRFP